MSSTQFDLIIIIIMSLVLLSLSFKGSAKDLLICKSSDRLWKTCNADPAFKRLVIADPLGTPATREDL